MSNLTVHQETLLRRWIAGELNRREEAELEALAREDDFLAEALAGLRARPEADHGTALTRLRTRLEDRHQPHGGGFAWRRLAAAVLLLLVAGTAVWLWPALGVNPAKETAESLAEAAPAPAPPPAPPVAERKAVVPPAEVPVRRETARAADPAPAPRREQLTAAPDAPRAPAASSPAEDELPVARGVPPAVLPPPPPPPPPPPAPMSTMLSDERVAASPTFREEVADDAVRSAAALPAPAAPTPYSVGAKAIAADTPNAVPDSNTGDLSTAPSRMAYAARSPGRGRTIRGYLRDDTGDPLPGVMVTTPGAPAGLFTDSAGYFELRVDRTVDRLQFSNTGYAEEEITIAEADTYLEVTLDEEVTESLAFDAAFAKTTIIPDERNTMVAPPGGYRQLRRQLRTEKPAGLPAGRVRLEFTITAQGKLSKFRVLETPDQRLSQWLIEQLRQTGAWAFKHGEGPHTVRYSVKLP